MVLGIGQLIVAVILVGYAPYHRRAQVHAIKAFHPHETIDNFFPEPLLPVAYEINFPAVAGACVAAAVFPVSTAYAIGLNRVIPFDVFFLFFVFLLWYWFGLRLEGWLRAAPVKWNLPQKLVWPLKMIGLAISLFFTGASILALVGFLAPPTMGKGILASALIWGVFFSVHFIKAACEFGK